MPNVIEVDDTTFETQVEAKDAGLVLVDFWAPWCGPCRLMAPIMEKLAAEHAGRLRVVKVDVDRSPLTADRFGIRSIPTTALFLDGAPLVGFAGAATKAAVDSFLDAHAPQLREQTP